MFLNGLQTLWILDNDVTLRFPFCPRVCIRSLYNKSDKSESVVIDISILNNDFSNRSNAIR